MIGMSIAVDLIEIDRIATPGVHNRAVRCYRGQIASRSNEGEEIRRHEWYDNCHVPVVKSYVIA